jgi:MFS family permease
VVFFLLNWTPRLLEVEGLPPQAGVAAAMAINLGSLLGGLTFGLLTDRFGWRRTGPAYAFGFAIGLAAFGAVVASPALLFALAVALGVFLGGSMTSLYALAPVVFPPTARVGGTGLVIGLGRCGGVLGPLLAASGLAAGLSAPHLYVGSAAGAAVVGALIVALGRRWLGPPPGEAAPPADAPAALSGETLLRPAGGQALRGRIG